MSRKSPFTFSLNWKLVLMMLCLSFVQISVLLFFYSQTENELFQAIEQQATELTGAIQIGVEEITASGTTDEARLSKYLRELNTQGIKEISIISNAKEIVASSNPSKIGQPLTHKKRELIIKAELGEHVSEEGQTYNVILPVIAGDTQYGYLHLKFNKDDFSRLLRVSAGKRIAATVFVFGIGILTTLLLSRRYTRPIRQVADAARRVSAGDLNQNIPPQGRDEVAQLAADFNLMVEKLRENRSLEEKLREAEHLSGLGQLSRHMAHEIRNPLNFINLSVAHIGGKYSPNGADERKKFDSLIGGIKEEVQRLNRLVDDFLNYSRPIKLHIQRVEIDKLLEDVLSLIWAKAEADGIEIIREYVATRELDVDPGLFKSCLLNVITNAFHAMGVSGKGGVLRVRTEIVGNEFVLSVIDNGTGVAPHDLSRIFEPFFSTRQEGLGLGLPMTKRVMEEQGGLVEFHSVEGQGSEVRLILPLNMHSERIPRCLQRG
ncbi:MAG: HAMP domain-containing protein [Desulfovibrionales bacterium]|nr:HAMP domain-containing protein [Desulfovibrionales bacterium]